MQKLFNPLYYHDILIFKLKREDKMKVFKCRLGPDPHGGGGSTAAMNGCPDIWELENGDFAVIGIRKTEKYSAFLPETASCGPDEEIVVIPRSLLINAKSDIPNG
jgi:hypothetical protein